MAKQAQAQTTKQTKSATPETTTIKGLKKTYQVPKKYGVHGKIGQVIRAMRADGLTPSEIYHTIDGLLPQHVHNVLKEPAKKSAS